MLDLGFDKVGVNWDTDGLKMCHRHNLYLTFLITVYTCENSICTFVFGQFFHLADKTVYTRENIIFTCTWFLFQHVHSLKFLIQCYRPTADTNQFSTVRVKDGNEVEQLFALISIKWTVPVPLVEIRVIRFIDGLMC
jgi:hypothetical protein